MTTTDRYALFLAEQLCRLGVHFEFAPPDGVRIIDYENRIDAALRSELLTHSEALRALLTPSPRALAKARRIAITQQATPMIDRHDEQSGRSVADAPITSAELRRFTTALAAKLEPHTTPERARQVAAEYADRAGRDERGQVEARSPGGIPYAPGTGKDAMTLLAEEAIAREHAVVNEHLRRRAAEHDARAALNPLLAPPEPYKNPLL